jgi:plastocyanin domain-containing protein
MTLIVNFLGVVLIGLIIGWFWLSKPKAMHSDKSVIQVQVKDGVYLPARIEVSAKQPVTLEFIRQDASSCAEYVVFDELDIHQQLPLNKPYKVALGRLKPGKYSFACQMKMYLGELVVLK